jgi:hypothetical protein
VIRIVRAVVSALGTTAMLCAAAPLHAQGAGAPPREFDFVVGNWLVRDSAGHAIGTVTVSHAYGGCVLIERWHGAANSGEGLGAIGYEPASRSWHRDYLDRGGVVLAFDGRLEAGSMVMTGKDYRTDVARMNRVTWTPRSDGSVEERWQTSTDDGRSWHAHFYGVLERIAE